jgi:hypothetical protein
VNGEIGRRGLLQILAATPALQAQHAHETVPVPAAKKGPVYFDARQFRTLGILCQMIVPPSEGAGGAMEAGVPEFIDLLATENADYQRRISGGLLWLDIYAMERFGSAFADCPESGRKEILDKIAFRGNAALGPGVQFFELVRDLTLDGYFTSRTGIEYLGYRGNSALPEFPGCPSEK